MTTQEKANEDKSIVQVDRCIVICSCVCEFPTVGGIEAIFDRSLTQREDMAIRALGGLSGPREFLPVVQPSPPRQTVLHIYYTATGTACVEYGVLEGEFKGD